MKLCSMVPGLRPGARACHPAAHRAVVAAMRRPHPWLLAIGLATALPCAAVEPQLIVQSAALAGLRYHAAQELWPVLRAGDVLELAREPDNVHDGDAVRVLWKGRLLGYLPRHENDHVAAQLARGVPLTARLAKLVRHRNGARRLEIEIYARL